MPFCFDSLLFIEVASIVENKVDKVAIFMKSNENDDILLFDVMHGWSPIFNHDTFPVYKLGSFFPYIKISFLESEWFSAFLWIFLFFVGSQIKDHLVLSLNIFPDVSHDAKLFKVLRETENFTIIILSTFEEQAHLVYSTFFDKK